MSDADRHHELDDELISAYLDDELSVEDRAAVERRLAADPAAQRLLHELRLVSQSVQAMPQQNMGRDLSETIVALIEQERKPSPAPADSTRPGGKLPKLPIFGSRRAWVWASLALAAGLLIMVVERGDDRGNKLATLDHREVPRDQFAVNKPSQQPSGGANREEEVALDRAVSPRASVVADNGRLAKEPPMPSAQAPAGGEVASVRQSGNPVGSAGLAASAPKATDSKTAGALSQSGAGAAGTRPWGTISGSPQAAGQVAKSENMSSFGVSGGAQAETRSHGPLIVQVVMTPEALEKKSFERLLAKNGIAVEADQMQDRSRQLGERRFKAPAEKQPAAASAPMKTAEAKQPVLLVVDATSGAIDACLKSLHDDTANFVSVAIDESQSGNDQSKDKSRLHDSELDRFGRYARGSVKLGTNDGLNIRRDFYNYSKETSTRQLANESSKSESLARSDEPIARHAAASPERKREGAEMSGRAVRLPANAKVSTSAGEKSQQGNDIDALKFPAEDAAHGLYGLEPSAKEKSDPDKLRVVFVLIPEDARAPSQPPADAAK